MAVPFKAPLDVTRLLECLLSDVLDGAVNI